jgi:hypothetical protein
MKCAHCLDEMNDGASVCHACGRRQPISKSTKRTLFFCTMGFAAIGLGIYIVAAKIERGDKINRLVLCGQFHGAEKTIDARFLREQIDVLKASGSSWEDAYSIEAALLGCPTQ